MIASAGGFDKSQFLVVAEGLQCLQVVVGQANIEAAAVDHQAEETIFLTQPVKGGRELKFAAFADVVGDVFFEIIKDLGLDDVLAENGQVFVIRQARDAQIFTSVFDSRFFGKFGDVEQIFILHPDPRNRAEVGKLRLRRLAQADDADAALIEGID